MIVMWLFDFGVLLCWKESSEGVCVSGSVR